MVFSRMHHAVLLRMMAVLFFMGFLAGCASIPVSQDYDTSAVLKVQATYQWLPESMQPRSTADADLKQYPFIAERMKKAIQTHLINRGAIFVAEAPQAYVNYRYEVTQSQVLVPASSVGLGWHTRGFGMGSSFPMAYETQMTEDSRWIVEIYNTMGKLIWQGSSSRPVYRYDSPVEAQHDTQVIVDAILNQFPPK